MDAGTMQLGRGESIADTARVLSRYVDAIMIRTDDHEKVVEMAAHATVPVINGLTDHSHPCQVVADMLTVLDRTGRLAGTRWAWLGDGNNVAHSLMEAARLLGFTITLGVPEGYDPSDAYLSDAARVVRDAREAVDGADVVVTDSWISMGQADSEAKLASMTPFAVTEALMAVAGNDALFLHCLPAHRGEEVVDAVLDGPASAAWLAAVNRVHAQKAVLLWALGR
jgi:ornithine carbamoyltransferase